MEALNNKNKLKNSKQKGDSPAKDMKVKLPTKSEQKVTAAEQKSIKKKQAEQVRNLCVYSWPGDRVWLPIGQYQVCMN